MTANPYAAPESVAHPADPLSHFRAIRIISRIFRPIGWIIIVFYGTISVAAAFAFAYCQLFADPDWINPFTDSPNSPLINLGVVIGYAGMAWIGWLIVRTGHRLIDRHPSAYREAMILSIIMLSILPLTLFAIYIIVQLRRHWRAYCEAEGNG